MSQPNTVYVYTATLAPRDAVSGQAVEHARVLRSMGFDAVLVADGVHGFFDHPTFPLDDALSNPAARGWLVHFGVWSHGLERIIEDARGPKVLVHHNTTPPELLPEGLIREVCQEAIDRLPELADCWTAVIADSTFNITELRAAGFHDGEVIPPLIQGEIRHATMARTKDIMAIGRIAPSKGLDRAVKATAIVNQIHGLDTELHIIGSDAGWESYSRGLRTLIERSGALVRMEGSLNDAQRDDLYATVGALVITSQHEGFCVPLVEAMRHGTPIIAVDVGAVTETLGGAGLLLPNADPRLVAEAIRLVLTDNALREQLSSAARTRAKAFAYDEVGARLRETLTRAFGPLSAP